MSNMTATQIKLAMGKECAKNPFTGLHRYRIQQTGNDKGRERCIFCRNFKK